MKYIYRMSKDAYILAKIDARKSGMSVERYITEYFGLLGKCIKVEVV